MMRKHYERIITACAFAFIFANIGIPSTSFSVFQPYIVELIGDTGGSLVLFTRAGASLVGMLLVDFYLARLDVRAGVTLATVLTGTGFAIYAVAHSLPIFLLGAVFAGLGYGFGGMVAATMLLSRWYSAHVSTAVGIAAVGSGVASVLLPLLALRLIAHGSLSLAFSAEAAIAFAIATAIALALRNRPTDIGAEPYHLPSNAQATTAHPEREHGPGRNPSPRMRHALLVAMFLLGSIAYGGTAYLTVLMTSEGFSPVVAGFLFSLMGAALTLSKFGTGVLFDRIGTNRGSELLFAMLIISLALCCFMPTQSLVIAGAAALTYGIGISLATVGISVWSLELTDPMHLSQTVKRFQLAYATGGVVFNILPGILMEATGTYVVSYGIMLAFAVATGAVVRAAYRSVGRA